MPDPKVLQVQQAIDALYEYGWRADVFAGADAPIHDVFVRIALLQAAWIRGRYLIEFLTNRRGIRGRDILDGWSPEETLPAPLQQRLDEYECQRRSKTARVSPAENCAVSVIVSVG